MRRPYWLLFLAALVVPTAAYALDILSGGGFRFDIQERSGGTLSDGGNPGMSIYDSYDGAYYLEVNSMTYTAGGGETTMGGRGVDMADAVCILGHLFLGGPHPTCLKTADVADSTVIDTSDVIRLLFALFRGGAPPESPYPLCGRDLDSSEPDCRAFPPCE